MCVCVGVYIFVRPKYMCTYYRAPKAREQRLSDCTRLAWGFMYLLDLNICVLIIERRRRESSGRRTARAHVCVCVGFYVFVRPKYMSTYYRAPKAREQRSSDCTRLAAKPLAGRVLGVYVFLRPKYMCIYYRTPKAHEQRSSKPLAALVRGCLCIC